jgi:hypothetical protein
LLFSGSFRDNIPHRHKETREVRTPRTHCTARIRRKRGLIGSSVKLSTHFYMTRCLPFVHRVEADLWRASFAHKSSTTIPHCPQLGTGHSDVMESQCEAVVTDRNGTQSSLRRSNPFPATQCSSSLFGFNSSLACARSSAPLRPDPGLFLGNSHGDLGPLNGLSQLRQYLRGQAPT